MEIMFFLQSYRDKLDIEDQCRLLSFFCLSANLGLYNVSKKYDYIEFF